MKQAVVPAIPPQIKFLHIIIELSLIVNLISLLVEKRLPSSALDIGCSIAAID